MRKQIFITLLLGLLLAGLATNAQQQQHFPDLHPDSVMRQDPRISQTLIVPGEMIVRFQDDLNITLVKSNGKMMAGINAIDELFDKWDISEAEPLIPGAEVLKTKQMLTTFNGKEFERPSLHNIFKLKTSVEPHKLFEAINALNESKHIRYAEPNFIVSIAGAEPLSPPLNEQELLNWINENGMGDLYTKSNSVVVPDDPLYSQQWGISATQIDQVWETTTGTPDQIIAILDTGVDWNHPDLAENIWNNSDESANGADSDGNGFVDDVRGWDFVNNDNNPADDNSHGTHVAGIAAARGNNGIGIAGANWAAKIMPVKVFQSSGQGNMATIVQGINYAAQNGATVINMSFGTYARSLALEDALANAYANAALVAAAGNDGLCIGPGRCQDLRFGMPLYPGGLSFVLGITSTPASFTNFDQDGPVYSNYSELYNYELNAPGTQIVSTIPNGGYRVYNGTSMASPLAAGAVAFYRSLKPQESQEILWGNIIQTSTTFLQINNALNVIPQPLLSITSHEIDDSSEGDGDGNPDSGEAINLWITAKNSWGNANNVQTSLRLGEFEDPSVATISNTPVAIGSISAYAQRSNNTNPFRVQFSDNLIHGRIVEFEVAVWEEGSIDTVSQILTIKVTNAVKVQGLITDSVTWTPDKTYFVINNIRISEQGKLIILPGTTILFQEGKSIDVRGELQAIGTNSNRIKFIGSSKIAYNFSGFSMLYNDNFINRMKVNYAEFNNFSNLFLFTFGQLDIQNSMISNCSGFATIGYNVPGYFNKNLFDSNINFNFQFDWSSNIKNNIVSNNKNLLGDFPNWASITLYSSSELEFTENSFFGNKTHDNHLNLSIRGNESFINITNNYWGTTDSINIQNSIEDFYFNNLAPIAIFSPYLTTPSAETHGHVWKILINGADAQDEFVEPVGVGQQRFDVYFNRSMDPAYPPQFTFGVRAPYTQQAVAENGSWSADHKVYTAYKTMQLYTGDGINTIRVSGAKDLEGFEIPVEDSRFKFLINAAGSASTDFTAVPGIGKVDLEWTYPEDLPTLLGFNVYRFHHLTDTTFSDTTLVNNTLLSDTLFTDFNVLPHQKYYYMYKIVRTDFTESDYSKVVNATVLTASPGDANGDLAVNILDITSLVSFILNGNPQPFIFDAADVNADGQLNLLDVIGVVNIIMNGNKSGVLSKPATVYLNTEQAEIKSDGTLAGLQFQLIGKNIEQLELKNLPKGFEFIRMISGDTLTGILFNMQNNSLPEGRISLFDIALHPGTLEWGEVFGGNYLGKYIPVFTSEDALPVDHRYSFNVYPNPAKDYIQTDIGLPGKSTVNMKLFDMYGLSTSLLEKVVIENGRHNLRFDKQQLPAARGLYILQIQINPLDKNELPFRKEVKLLIL